ncbi:death-on-curing family protein [Leptolyngbya sp. NIES-3755]|nr:death-on-curing family protein [Leptolyngbya sp. NIES-3755]
MTVFIVALPMPKFIEIADVMRIHDSIIDRYGGASGIRDLDLLDSALAQPQVTFAGELLHPTIWDQAAAYLFHISMNHPFLDGNKRTAFAIADTFLRINGYVLDLTEDEKFEFVIRVVTGNLNKDEIARFLERSSVPI